MTIVALRPSQKVTLTKRQLANHLGRSERWIELRVREGLPSLEPTGRDPRRRFVLDEVEAWLAKDRPADRIAVLEERIARLERLVGV